MNTATKLLLTSAIAAAMSVGTAFAAGPGVAGRQVNQQKRIHQGVRSGELTRPEAAHLERTAARIHRSIVRDRVDQGVFTPRERAKAEHRLNRQSRAIYRQKHDNQQR